MKTEQLLQEIHQYITELVPTRSAVGVEAERLELIASERVAIDLLERAAESLRALQACEQQLAAALTQIRANKFKLKALRK